MIEHAFEYIRIGLYAVLVAVLFLLFQAWNQDYPKQHSVVSSHTIEETIHNNYVPTLSKNELEKPSITNTTHALGLSETKGNVVHVITNTFDVSISTQGGNIIGVKLLQYTEQLHSSTPFTLLVNTSTEKYLAQSGLISSLGPDTAQEQALYTTQNNQYTFDSNQETLAVPFYWQNANGIKVTKTFIFKKNSYEISVIYDIENQSSQSWEGNSYAQFLRTNTPPEHSSGLSNLTTYFGAAISSPQKTFQKITFKEMEQKNVNEKIQGGWAAMVQHYFVSAWIPPKESINHYYSRANGDLYTIGFVSPSIVIPPGGHLSIPSLLYSGPAQGNLLEQAAPGLQLTIDYGFFWFISIILFWMMQHIYDVVGNWGWSIVLVTLIIKLLFYHLSAKSYRSMSAMKKLQPRMEQLKESYGEDKQKFTQAMLELYRKEKVNPMSGCLPILVQIPVFIALYWVLVESVQLRQAPFIFWIQDLATKDPYYVLPLLMGISMFLQQRLNPPPPDPLQAKVMMLMPVIFTALFFNFPSGLMLYWFVNNTLSYLQQWFIMHRMEKDARR